MKKYRLIIYGREDEEIYNDEDEAESQKEYLERTQDKICTIYEEENDEDEE